MEARPGEDLAGILRSLRQKLSPPPLGAVLRVIADAAHGLHFAHELTDDQGRILNLVHRDVSPSNVFVTYQGQVKLLDFVIAKAESRVTQTTTGIIKGKSLYMAPEHARDAGFNRRADIFAL